MCWYIAFYVQFVLDTRANEQPGSSSIYSDEENDEVPGDAERAPLLNHRRRRYRSPERSQSYVEPDGRAINASDVAIISRSDTHILSDST